MGRLLVVFWGEDGMVLWLVAVTDVSRLHLYVIKAFLFLYLNF